MTVIRSIENGGEQKWLPLVKYHCFLDLLIILGIREDILKICAIQKKLFLVSYI